MSLPELFLAAFLLLGQGNPAWEHATVSAYAVDLSTGTVLLDEQSGRSLTPGSCMKLPATGAAIELLGPEYQFRTDLLSDGIVEKGVLRGNVVIQGGGDPCLGSDRIRPALAWEQQIQVWADAVERQGIRQIEGTVIGDASLWETARAAPTWTWEDLGNYYGAGASALSFHENSYTLTFQPGAEVDAAAVVLRTDPPLPILRLQNEVKTGPVGSGDRACIYGSEFSPIHYVRGTVPAGVAEFSIRGAIPDSAVLCALLLQQALEARGIVVGTQPLPRGGETQRLHTTYSPPLRAILYWTNQLSLNLHAEHLLKKLGEALLSDGSTEGGCRAVTAFWQAQQVDLSGFRMADGSGLSRNNLITTKQLVEMLMIMKHSEHFPLFLESLPKPHEGVRAKSGGMALVSSYAGYVGDRVAFAIIVNNCQDPQVRSKLQQFLRNLSQAVESEASCGAPQPPLGHTEG